MARPNLLEQLGESKLAQSLAHSHRAAHIATHSTVAVAAATAAAAAAAAAAVSRFAVSRFAVVGHRSGRDLAQRDNGSGAPSDYHIEQGLEA